MTIDLWTELGEFVCEHYKAGLIIGLAIVIVALICQYLVNSSLEDDLIELTERVEALEKAYGIDIEDREEKEEK